MITKSKYMLEAIKEAKKAGDIDEVPIGAVIANKAGKIIARAGNLVEKNKDTCAHAEILAIRAAAKKKKSKFLDNCDIYVTLEPCPMCAHAISLARIRNLYFGAYDEKSGGVESGPRVLYSKSAHHKPAIYGGICESECSQLIKDFFRKKRN